MMFEPYYLDLPTGWSVVITLNIDGSVFHFEDLYSFDGRGSLPVAWQFASDVKKATPNTLITWVVPVDREPRGSMPWDHMGTSDHYTEARNALAWWITNLTTVPWMDALEFAEGLLVGSDWEKLDYAKIAQRQYWALFIVGAWLNVLLDQDEVATMAMPPLHFDRMSA